MGIDLSRFESREEALRRHMLRQAAIYRRQQEEERVAMQRLFELEARRANADTVGREIQDDTAFLRSLGIEP